MPDVNALIHALQGRLAFETLYETLTLSGDLDLSTAANAGRYPSVLGIDPGAARVLTLEEVSAAKGLLRVVVNKANGAETITVKDADANTIGTVEQDRTAAFWCDGETWQYITKFATLLS